MVPDHGLAIGKYGNVSSDVMARTVTVLGTVKGKLSATERVELLPSGKVEGRIVTASLIMDEGCYFKGVVDPTLRDTVLAVTSTRAGPLSCSQVAQVAGQHGLQMFSRAA